MLSQQRWVFGRCRRTFRAASSIQQDGQEPGRFARADSTRLARGLQLAAPPALLCQTLKPKLGRTNLRSEPFLLPTLSWSCEQRAEAFGNLHP